MATILGRFIIKRFEFIVVRTIITALIGFMPTPANSAVGSMESTDDEKKILAQEFLKQLYLIKIDQENGNVNIVIYQMKRF